MTNQNPLPYLRLAQMEVVPGQPEVNLRTALRMLAQAREQGAELVAIPELCLSGYLIGDLWEERSFVADCLSAGQDLIAATSGIAAVFGNVGLELGKLGEDGRPRRYNAAYLAHNGCVVRNDATGFDFFPKTLLPNYREFEETRHFYDLRRLARERKVSLESLFSVPSIPFRDGASLALGIILCEDGWGEDYGVHLVPNMVAQGAELIINLSASPYTRNKNLKRERVFSYQARACQRPIAYVNCIGSQNNGKTYFGFDGSSTIYGCNGETLSVAKPWTEILLSASEQVVAKDAHTSVTDVASPWATSSELEPADWDTLREVLMRYLQSAQITRVVIGASGGVDSAVSAAVFAQVCGPENVLLVSMPSAFNTASTRNLARQLATNLGCWFAEIPIGESVELTKRQIDGLTIERESPQGKIPQRLAMTAFHLENVQARDRSARILSALASAFGGVFPSNANKAETMVGYSTLYGDHGGFMAPLADLWKGEIYALGNFLNTNIYGREVIPKGIFEIKPSAELSAAQNPEQGGGDPILYGYHDRLFHAWQQDWNRASPEEILEWYSRGEMESRLHLTRPVGDYFPDAASFIADLERWWKLFKGMGVVKRVQAPPIIALSRRAFGFDYRESILQPFWSREYLGKKAQILNT